MIHIGDKQSASLPPEKWTSQSRSLRCFARMRSAAVRREDSREVPQTVAEAAVDDLIARLGEVALEGIDHRVASRRRCSSSCSAPMIAAGLLDARLA